MKWFHRARSLLGCLLAACGSEPDPSHTLVPGVYDYTMGMESVIRYTGVLYIDESTETHLSGRWEVFGYEPQLVGPMGWDEDAYVVSAKVSGTGGHLVTHRLLIPGTRCEGTTTIGTERSSRPVFCLLIHR